MDHVIRHSWWVLQVGWSISCLVRGKNVACHISEQRTLQPSSHQLLQPTSMVHPKDAILRTLRTEKHRMLPSDSSSSYEGNDFNEPRLLYLPIHRKAPNSSAWHVWFLISSNFLVFDFWLLFLFKNSYISWLLHYLLRKVPQSYLRGCIPSWRSQYSKSPTSKWVCSKSMFISPTYS